MRIPVKVYEEIKLQDILGMTRTKNFDFEWIEGTPYRITIVGARDE